MEILNPLQLHKRIQISEMKLFATRLVVVNPVPTLLYRQDKTEVIAA